MGILVGRKMCGRSEKQGGRRVGAVVAEDTIMAGNRILGGWVEDVGKRLNGGKQPLSW